jgi:asparagine synthase (glutamine-hydrolysing)
MCGIAGILASDAFHPSILVEMTQLIRYRGPDGFGFAIDSIDQRGALSVFHQQNPSPITQRSLIGLGNRRLAILDVTAAGSQPMQSADGNCTVTFNGEIYNYKEIRCELQALGHTFRTTTDTEVILHAYRQWGSSCLGRFNGMWAFALWDESKQELFCARDRFGVKPFYYTVHNRSFVFGSEIKQILHATRMPRVANARTCFYFLEWGLLDHSSDTFFNGIHQLPAGHSLTVHASRPTQPSVKPFWTLSTDSELELNDREAVEEFCDLFDSAVRLRLRSDVPVGVALSGGLDSSSVLCKAQQIHSASQFQTFSACFDEPEIDEREYIAAATRSTNAVGHPTYPQAKAFWSSLNTIIYHQDEPVGSPAAFAQWCVMAEARAHSVPVILSGQGGDETLCGYQKYHFFHLWHLLRSANPRFLREFAMWVRQGTSSYGQFAGVARYLPAPFRTRFSLTTRIATQEFRNSFGAASSGLGAARTLAERQKIDLIYASLPALLHHEDRSSMAHSVESRLPFLDYRLVEFALRCPSRLKLRDGWSKWLLRSALAGSLPDKIRLRRTKLGFNTPDTRWMRLGLQNGRREMWTAPNLRMERFIDPVRFRVECGNLVQNRGAVPASVLFRAVSLETWAQVYSVS